MSEFSEQKELITWFRDTYPRYIKCTRLSLNGVNLPAGKKAAIMINQFKSQGMVKGEADLLFLVPNDTYHGLIIEMKDFGKTTTADQDDYLVVMAALGYQAEVCEGADNAKRVVGEYMSTALALH